MISNINIISHEEHEPCFLIEMEFRYRTRMYTTFLVRYFSYSHRPDETFITGVFNASGIEVRFSDANQKRIADELLNYIKQHPNFRLLFLLDAI
jgi:hypothetical protein